MCSVKLVTSLCALLCMSPVMGRPQNTVDLADAVNNTLCPFNRHIDTNDERIPKHIEMITCAESAFEECAATASEDMCCRHPGSATSRQCYQIEEYVLVKYPNNSNDTVSVKVHVGCACMERPSIKAVPIS